MPYSSGTSGKPKGILRALSQAPFGTPTGLEQLLSGLYGLGEDAIYLSPAPQYHSAPVGWTMTVMFYGGTVVVLEPFDAEDVLRAIEHYKVTHAQFVPTHFVRLLKLPAEIRGRYDISSLRVAVHAAAPCPPDVKMQMMEWWGPILHEYYGGSERFGLTSIGPQDWLGHRGSVGQPQMGPAHIVDPETGGESFRPEKLA
jgi:long-chain acyl-CoA synthetase